MKLSHPFLLLLFPVILWNCKPGTENTIQIETRKKAIEQEVLKNKKDIPAFNQLLQKYIKNGNLYGQCVAYRELGKVQRNQSQFTTAIESHRKSLELAGIIRDTNELVQAMNNLGTNFRRIGALDEASDYHYNALKLSELYSGLNTPTGAKNRTIAINGLGNISLTLNHPDESMRYFRQALAIEKSLKSELGQAINYANIGAIFALKHQYDSAYYYYNESLKCNQKANSELGISLCYANIGHLYRDQQQYDKALEHYQQAYQIMKNNSDRWHWLDACLSIGNVYIQKKKFGKAEQYLNLGKNIAQGIGSREHQEIAHRFLSSLYQQEGKYKQALQEELAANRFQDSILNTEQQQRFMEMRIKYENEKNSRRIQELDHINQITEQEKKNILLIFFTFTALLLILILVLYNNSRLRKKKNREMKRIEEMKSNFFTNITHEFRTPLTVILGMSNHLLEQCSVAHPEARQNLQAIIRQGHQLLHLVNQMLDLARSESGADHPEWKNGDIVVYLNLLSEAFLPYAQDKGIELIFISSSDRIKMDFVPLYINKIIRNLLSNSLKHCSPGDRIILQVSTDEQQTHCKIEVRDTGSGIPAEELSKIFELYYTAGSSGTGIGLTLAKQLVEKLSGVITVRSTPRKETVFSIVLPISNQIVTPENHVTKVEEEVLITPQEESILLYTPEEPEDSNPKYNRQPALLIVEDNQDVALYISSVLSGDFRILFACNGKEGLQKAEENIPDLIITDLMMPEKDGFAFCREVRKSLAISHIPIIIVTAKNSLDDRLQGFKCGADAYLTKPFDEEELRTRVRQLLESRQHLMEKYCRMILQTEEPEIKDENLKFLQKVTDIIYREIKKPDFFPLELAREVCLSTSQLNRKLNAIAGHNCSTYVMQIRLTKARKLLTGGSGLSIGEIAFECGFNDLGYFSRSFKKEFGLTPSQYQRMP